MKRTLITLFLFIAAISSLKAQSFFKGTSVIAAGIGIGGSLGSFSYGSQAPGISLQFERGIWEIGGPGVISLGGYVGTKGYKYSGGSGGFNYSQKWNYTIVGVRSAYHYNGVQNEKFDLYGGLMLSYNILNYEYKDNGGGSIPGTGSYGSAAGITAYVGARYFLTENLGLFAEAGYGVSYLTLGAAFKW